MYLQNVLSCIEQKIENETRYLVHFGQVTQNQIYNLDLTTQVCELINDRINPAIQRDRMMNEIRGKKEAGESESTDIDEENKTETSFWRFNNTQSEFDKITSVRNQILESIVNQPAPKSTEEYKEIEAGVRKNYYRKHANLIKNTHQYLCYLYLTTYNYSKVLEHSKQVLKLASDFSLDELKLSDSMMYTIHTYMAEALCMSGNFQEALEYLDTSDQVVSDYLDRGQASQSQPIIGQVESDQRKINVQLAGEFSMPGNQQESCERLNIGIVNKLNRCVVYLNKGDLQEARNLLDEVIQD